MVNISRIEMEEDLKCAQDLHSLVRTATNSLETMLESQRAADSRTTGERQADLQVTVQII